MANEHFYGKLFATPGSTITLSDLLKRHTTAPTSPYTPPSRLSDFLAPPPVYGSQGIKFQCWNFTEPTRLGLGLLPKQAGIYAILVFDSACKPRPYRVIYFGKAVDLQARVCTTHEKYDAWSRCAGGVTLYVALHLMPGSSEFERASLEENLIKYYAPECNKTFNPFEGLFARNRMNG